VREILLNAPLEGKTPMVVLARETIMRPMNTLRIVHQRPPWVLLGLVWAWHGALIDERFLVGMN
jgi:hypothetical protein